MSLHPNKIENKIKKEAIFKNPHLTLIIFPASSAAFSETATRRVRKQEFFHILFMSEIWLIWKMLLKFFIQGMKVIQVSQL